MIYVRGDIILCDAQDEYGTFNAAIKGTLGKSPKQITVPEVDHNDKVIGTRILWLPRSLLDDFRARDLWLTVKLDEYEDTIEKVYPVPVTF